MIGTNHSKTNIYCITGEKGLDKMKKTHARAPPDYSV
jgi:hypothetical protein